MSTEHKAIRIAHFSDLHLVPTQNVPFAKLLGKRMLGYANLKLNRGRTHSEAPLRHLIERVAKENADRVVVTGDFTSLALDFEFAHIDRIFRESGLTPESTMVIPGNHDRYTFAADHLHAFENGLSAWLPSNMSRRTGYPIIEALGPIVLFGLDTAVWRNPARAAGAIADDQLKRLVAALRPERLAGRWPVIAMHHPPFHRGNKALLHYRTGLSDFSRFVENVRGPATVIHGHMHKAVRRQSGALDIIGIPSASNNTGNPTTQLAYYVYTFDQKGLRKVDAHRFWPDTSGGRFTREHFELPKGD